MVLGENGEINLNSPSNKKTDQDFHNMVNITLGGQRDQMVHIGKKFSYLAIVAGVVMLSMTFISPPAFAAEGGDSGLSKPILALAAAIAIAGGLIGTGSAQQGIGAAGMGIIAEFFLASVSDFLSLSFLSSSARSVFFLFCISVTNLSILKVFRPRVYLITR